MNQKGPEKETESMPCFSIQNCMSIEKKTSVLLSATSHSWQHCSSSAFLLIPIYFYPYSCLWSCAVNGTGDQFGLHTKQKIQLIFNLDLFSDNFTIPQAVVLVLLPWDQEQRRWSRVYPAEAWPVHGSKVDQIMDRCRKTAGNNKAAEENTHSVTWILMFY